MRGSRHPQAVSSQLSKYLLAAVLSCPSLTQACTMFPGYQDFKPAPTTFTARMDGTFVALLPAPRVGNVHLTRGTSADSGMCGGIGTLTLDVEWPASSIYKLGEIGFYFRVVGASRPDEIFPLKPVTGANTGQRSRFTFIWVDGHPSEQRPLNLDIEVFAVNKGLEIGPAHRFRIADRVKDR